MKLESSNRKMILSNIEEMSFKSLRVKYSYYYSY